MLKNYDLSPLTNFNFFDLADFGLSAHEILGSYMPTNFGFPKLEKWLE